MKSIKIWFLFLFQIVFIACQFQDDNKIDLENIYKQTLFDVLDPTLTQEDLNKNNFDNNNNLDMTESPYFLQSMNTNSDPVFGNYMYNNKNDGNNNVKDNFNENLPGLSELNQLLNMKPQSEYELTPNKNKDLLGLNEMNQLLNMKPQSEYELTPQNTENQYPENVIDNLGNFQNDINYFDTPEYEIIESVSPVSPNPPQNNVINQEDLNDLIEIIEKNLYESRSDKNIEKLTTQKMMTTTTHKLNTLKENTTMVPSTTTKHLEILKNTTELINSTRTTTTTTTTSTTTDHILNNQTSLLPNLTETTNTPLNSTFKMNKTTVKVHLKSPETRAKLVRLLKNTRNNLKTKESQSLHDLNYRPFNDFYSRKSSISVFNRQKKSHQNPHPLKKRVHEFTDINNSKDRKGDDYDENNRHFIHQHHHHHYTENSSNGNSSEAISIVHLVWFAVTLILIVVLLISIMFCRKNFKD